MTDPIALFPATICLGVALWSSVSVIGNNALVLKEDDRRARGRLILKTRLGTKIAAIGWALFYMFNALL